MKKPKEGKPYCFVRRTSTGFEHTEYQRFTDGSAGFAADGMQYTYDNDPNAWLHALDALQGMGFVELQQGKSAGIVPAEWEPSAENHVFAPLRAGDA